MLLERAWLIIAVLAPVVLVLFRNVLAVVRSITATLRAVVSAVGSLRSRVEIGKDSLWRVAAQLLLVAADFCGQPRKTGLLLCHLVLTLAEGANVEVSREGLHSCFREVLKPACKLASLVLLRVEVRAVDLLARARVFALFSLEEIWMVLQLLPTM